MEEKKPFYISSKGQGLALTVKGLLVSLIPLVLIAAKFYGIGIEEGELNELVTMIEGGIVAVFGIIATVMTAYGLIRKIALRFKK